MLSSSQLEYITKLTHASSHSTLSQYHIADQVGIKMPLLVDYPGLPVVREAPDTTFKSPNTFSNITGLTLRPAGGGAHTLS